MALESEFRGAQLGDILKTSGRAFSGSKAYQVMRIAAPPDENRGDRPSRQQLIYVAAVMRRQQKIPPISVVRNKRQCSGWLTEHGDWTPGR